MNYLLDSNICIHLFRGRQDVYEKINKVNIEKCSISEITYLELLYGAECSSNPVKNKKIIADFISTVRVIPISDTLERFAVEKSKLKKKGLLISDFDLLIGVTALIYKFILVTENTREFERIPKLKFENWIDRSK
jgi:tRNA(fMet)-specific endonuclease VapC